MSDRICFKSSKNEDISKLELPEIIGANNEFGKPYYEEKRNLIFTFIKTIEFYGDRLYGIYPDEDYVKKIKEWADKNNLIITSDYREK